MKLSMLLKRFGFTGFAVLGLPAGFALAADTQESSDLIHGCYQKNSGNLRIVNGPSECRSGEVPISWNMKGPPAATRRAYSSQGQVMNKAHVNED